MGGYRQMPITPYNPPDPMEGITRGIQLSNLMRGGQLQQEQLRGAQMENQIRQKQMTADDALMRAYHDAGGDLDRVPGLAAQYGAHPKAIVDFQTKRITQAKELAAQGEQAIKRMREVNGIVGSAAQTALQAPPEQRGQIIQGAIGQLVQAGGLDQQSAQGQWAEYQRAEQQGQAEGWLRTHAMSSIAADRQLELATKLPGEQAQSAISQLEAQNMQKYGTKEQRKPVPGVDVPLSPEVQAQKIAIAQNSRAVNPMTAPLPGNASASGEDYLRSLPAQDQAIVRQIGTGKFALNRLDYMLTRNPNLGAMVAQGYPDFDSSKVKSYGAAYQDFTSGTTSKQVNAGAVAIQHLAQLKQINDANPTEVRIPGTQANKAYQNLLDTVSDELVTFYGEPKTNESIASKKRTLGGLLNRDAAITEQANAMGVKLDELETKWKNAAPSSAYQAPMPGISAAAKKARAFLDPSYQSSQQGAAGGYVRIQASDGSLHDIPQANLGAARQRDPSLKVVQQ